MRKLGERDAGSIIGTLSTGEKILSYPPRGFVVGFEKRAAKLSDS
jgi:hypothetical protein